MRKVNISKFSKFSFICVSVMLVAITVISLLGLNAFHTMRKTTKQYMLCENATHQLQLGSDVLTNQVRFYAVTGNTEYLNNYFEEVNVTKNREHAVEELQKNFDKTDMLKNLQIALNESYDLMKIEYYAMRLTAKAYGTADELLPEELADVQISEYDAALPADKMREKACTMVFNEDYQKFKGDIADHTDKCLNGLTKSTESRQKKAVLLFRYIYAVQCISIVALALYILIENIIMQKAVIRPISVYNKKIRHGQQIPVTGATELQSLAVTYNKIREENRRAQMQIKYEAEHDSLTDLLNKGAFNRILADKIGKNKPFSLVVADIDEFKIINDMHGHAFGDEIIKLVAQKMQEIFGNNDSVFRVGGDEFAVIIEAESKNSREVVNSKFAELKNELNHLQTDNLAGITVSAGAAFFDGGIKSDDLFKNADKSLYRAKNNGKDSICFFENQ